MSTTAISSKERLDQVKYELEEAKDHGRETLVQLVLQRIREKAEKANISVEEFEDWLSGRSFGFFFSQTEQSEILRLANEFFLSPNNLGINVVRELKLEWRLQLSLCVVGRPTRLDGIPVEQYIFLRAT